MLFRSPFIIAVAVVREPVPIALDSLPQRLQRADRDHGGIAPEEQVNPAVGTFLHRVRLERDRLPVRLHQVGG